MRQFLTALPAAALLLLLMVPMADQVMVAIGAERATPLRPPVQTLINSGVIALAAIFTALLLGGITAIWTMTTRRVWLRFLIGGLAALPLAIPMYLHGMASWQVVVAAGFYTERPDGGSWTDLLVVGGVQGMRLAAVVHLLLLAGWSSLDGRWLEAGLMAGTRCWVRRHLLLPLLMPFAALAALLVGVMSIGDVGVPLLFQVRRVMAIHLWNAHYTALDTSAAWRAMLLPIVALAIAMAFTVPALWRRAAPILNAKRDPVTIDLFPRMPVRVLGVIALTAMHIPMLHLLRQVVSLSALAETFRANGPLMLASVETALGATVVALLIGGLLAFTLHSERPLALTLLLILFTVPGFLWAAAAIPWWNAHGLRGWMLDHGVVRWLVLGGRLLVIPALLLALAYARQSPRQREAAMLAGLGPWTRARAVTWPALRRAAWVAYALCALMVVGDLDAAILMDLPGKTTLVVGLCNRLHISPRSPEVAMVAVVIMTTVALLLTAPPALGFAWRRLRRQP